MPDAPNFDCLAGPYERLERLAFGDALWRRRIRYLADARLATAEHALVLGEGDGRFIAALAARYPELQLTAVDASAAMLDAQRRRVEHAAPGAKLELQCADLRGWSPTRMGYDLVVTHFVFDCFTAEEIAALVARILPALAPDARWLVSEFALPTRGLRRLFWRLLIRTLYFAQRRITGLEVTQVPEYATALRTAGFERAAAESEFGGALCSELWQRRRPGGG